MKVFFFLVLVLCLVALVCSTPCRRQQDDDDDEEGGARRRRSVLDGPDDGLGAGLAAGAGSLVEGAQKATQFFVDGIREGAAKTVDLVTNPIQSMSNSSN